MVAFRAHNPEGWFDSTGRYRIKNAGTSHKEIYYPSGASRNVPPKATEGFFILYAEP